MAYLAVNKDGSEFIYDYEIERYIGLATSDSNQLICFSDVDLKRSDFWTMKNNLGYNFPKYGIYANRIPLPDGSIEKLIGRKLTWNDKPVEL